MSVTKEINDKTRSIEEVLSSFKFDGGVEKYYAYGNGHINDTFKVECENKNYILQRINTDTFKDPVSLIENIKLVTQHVQKKNESLGLKDVQTLTLIELNTGGYLYKDSTGYYWRAYDFVENTVSYDLVEKPEHFYESAVAFGRFQASLSDFDPSQLVETIPDFHNTPNRVRLLKEAIELDPQSRLKLVQEEVAFVLEREAFTSKFTELYEEGTLKKRVTHNDTKLNNVLLNAETGSAVCVIDLDTVMPGFVLDDFGDSIRFGANTALEDEKDLTKVRFDMNLFDVYIEGFLKGAGDSITDLEISLFPESAKMMTLECGIRFLTDYLMGDTYFKTQYDEHNLVRCRTQFKLIKEMEDHWSEMEKITSKYMQ